MRGTSDQPGARRSSRDRLIEAATNLFYRRGFRAVSVDDVAAHSGLTKSTLYRYFTSKDELAVACLSKLAKEHLQAFAQLDAQFPDAPEARLRAIVVDAASRIRRPAYRGWPLSMAEAEIGEEDHPISQACRAYKAKVHGHLARAARQAGYEAPGALADGMVLLLEGAGASWRGLGHDGAATSLERGWAVLMHAYGHQQDAA